MIEKSIDIYNYVNSNLSSSGLNDSPVSVISEEPLQDKDSAIIGGHLVVVPVTGAYGIQAAINTVAKAGGGEVKLLSGVYKQTDDIELPSNVTLSGAGVSSIIDFRGAAFSIKALWDSVTELENIHIKNLTVRNSADVQAIRMTGVQLFSIVDVVVRDNTGIGVFVSGCELFHLTNVVSTDNSGRGFLIQDQSTHSTQTFTLTNCTATDNGGSGFQFAQTNASLSDFTVVSCISFTNTLQGFNFTGGDVAIDAAFIACNAEANGVNGFDVDIKNVSFIGCVAESNTGDGFEISQGETVRVVGSMSSGNGTDFDVQVGGAYVGNWQNSMDIDTSEENLLIGPNVGQNVNSFRRDSRYVNNSGGTRTVGDVVVYSPTGTSGTTSRHISTTTTASDDRVLGVVVTATADDGEILSILTEGRTAGSAGVKVNGTTDIAIGDFLTTFTTAGIAAKAASGDIAFAVALEAYATDDSNGVIDAIIIPKFQLK